MAMRARYTVQLADLVCCGWLDSEQVHLHYFCWLLLLRGSGALLLVRWRCSFMRKGMQLAYEGLNVVVRLLPCIGLGRQQWHGICMWRCM